MRVITLERFSFTKHEVMGLLRIVGTSFKCITIERPWLNNKPFVSCIPASTYKMERSIYSKPTKPYDTWEVVKVPHRTYIKFHAANKGNEVQGCIALGNKLFVMDNRVAVENSMSTFVQFMANLVDTDEAALIISERRGV